MSSPPQKSKPWPKLLSIWMNAAVDAWNMGQASWLFDEQGHSVLTRLWAGTFERTGDELIATEAVRDMAQQHGVDPKIHRVHAK